MSVTRKMLKGMGLTEEQIDTIIEAHAETVDALKDERDKFKADATALVDVKKELEGLKIERDKFKSDATELDKVKKELEDLKSSQVATAEKNAKEAAYSGMLKEIGISDKHIAFIMKVTNLDDIHINKDGTLRDKEKLTEAAKSDWSDVIETKHVGGADTKKPPSNNGGNLTKEDILNIKDTAERQQKIAENHELFNF